jgi:hypothetical protein
LNEIKKKRIENRFKARKVDRNNDELKELKGNIK